MAYEIRVDASGAARKLRLTESATRDATRRWALRGGLLVQGVMRRVIAERVSPRASGQTVASVQVRQGVASAVIGPSIRQTRYGHFDPAWLDQGTRPHEIRPRFARVLAFPRAGSRLGFRGGRGVSVFRFGGRQTVTDLVYAQAVNHPGTKGIRFVAETVSRVEGPLVSLMEDELGRAAQAR